MLEVAAMTRLIEQIDRKLYRSFEDNWDDALFRQRILSVVAGRSVEMLDVGAGAGIVKQMNFRGIANHICGVDPDHRVVDNPFLDEGKVGMGNAIPYADESFDIVFADNVLEHLVSPIEVFSEVLRVLRPGGVFLTKTPNAWHYMPLIARLTPHAFHRWFNRLRGRQAEDTFPTQYRANTPIALRRWAGETGFAVNRICLYEGRPEYLRFSVFTYLCGAIYERLVNRFDLLARFRILLIAELRKPI